MSQYQEESADWMNLSKERIIDTQAEIEKLGLYGDYSSYSAEYDEIADASEEEADEE